MGLEGHRSTVGQMGKNSLEDSRAEDVNEGRRQRRTDAGGVERGSRSFSM